MTLKEAILFDVEDKGTIGIGRGALHSLYVYEGTSEDIMQVTREEVDAAIQELLTTGKIFLNPGGKYTSLKNRFD